MIRQYQNVPVSLGCHWEFCYAVSANTISKGLEDVFSGARRYLRFGSTQADSHVVNIDFIFHDPFQTNKNLVMLWPVYSTE